MEIFDELWHATSCSTIMKCWMTSECLPESHVQRCTEKLRDIVPISERIALGWRIRFLTKKSGTYKVISILSNR